MMLAKTCRIFFSGSLACLFLLLLTPLTTHADGGAPNRAYVAGTVKGISVIDVAQQKIIDHLSTSGGPQEVLLSPDARFLYVTQPQQGNLTILSVVTGSIVCKANVPGRPTLLALDTSSDTLYVAGNGSALVSAMNPNDCSIKRTLQAGGPVYGLAIAAAVTTNTGSNRDQVWVSTTMSLDVFNDNDGSHVSSIDIPAEPRYISIPPGSVAYVTTQQGSVLGVGLAKHTITSLLSGGQYGPMDFDEPTGEIFVPDRLHQQLDVIAPLNAGFAAPTEPERTIALGAAPNSVAITSDGQLGFVALQGGHVAMLDIPGRQLIATFDVGGEPQFIITGLNPPVIGTTPQQANVVTTWLPIAAYAFILALFIIPIVVIVRGRAVKQQQEV